MKRIPFDSLRGRIKKVFDRAGNERLRNNFLQALPFWVASLLTGLAAVLFAKLFALAELGTAYIFTHRSWLLLLISPVAFLAAWWIIVTYAPFARGSGIPQVMSAIELANPKDNKKVHKLLSLRIVVYKMLSSLVLVFGGGLIGREGPTIQVAGSIFRMVNQGLPAWWPKISKKNMIMAGAAAGLAAAFNTPLGGIVFAVEELTKTHLSYFKTALFSAVIIAGLTAQGLLGPYLYLGYPVVNNLSPFIFLGVLVVAIVCGLAGGAMSKAILVVFKWKASFSKPRRMNMIYVVCCGFIIAALAIFLDQRILGSGKQLMATTLFSPNKYLSWYVPLIRIGGVILSFTTGAAGGIFAPSLSAGACVGSVLAGWMHLSDSNTNLLVLSGMVAFLTGVTRTPFTSAILVLEMTDRHNLIFYLMLSAMVASIVSILIDRRSLYDHLKVQYIQDLNREERDIRPQGQQILPG